MRVVRVPAVVVASCVLAGGATAAIVGHYSAPSLLATGATPPPFAFAAGAHATDGAHVTSLAIGANGTTLSVSLRGVPHAQVVLPQLATLTSRTSTTQTIVLSAAPLTSAAVTAFRIDAVSQGATLASLDLRAPSPSASFLLAPGQAVDLRATLGLAEGAGQHNVDATTAIRTASSG